MFCRRRFSLVRWGQLGGAVIKIVRFLPAANMKGAKRHTKRMGGLNKLRDQPKVHWSVVPCEWDSDFQVGDTMDIPFQVRSISSLSNIVNVPQNWSWIVIVVNTLQPMFAIGSSPDLVYADLDGPGHSICGTGPNHYHWHTSTQGRGPKFKI